LGEETVAETNMEEIAQQLFDYQMNFRSFYDQVAELLEKNNQKFIERIQFKSSVDLIKKMDDYLLFLENNGFKPIDIFVNKKPIPAWFIEEKFKQYSRLPLLNRFNEVVREIVNNVWMYYNYEVQGKERTELHATIRKMFPSTNLRKLYKGFYEWLGEPELLKTRKGNVFEYSDVYPLLYLKMKLEGLKPFTDVKHLVIDEMQDYSAVQYKILNKLFNCKKTILGDINQSVNPFSASNMDTIADIFTDAIAMTMTKGYRSTYEITQFTKKISQNVNVEPIERHGEEPKILKCKNEEEELNTIKNELKNWDTKKFKSLGIICKTQKEANALYDAIDQHHQVQLLNALSVAFGSGIVITTAHLAKGLEFDRVIVPFVTENNYKTPSDRQMLYVACTRAMHKLMLTYSKKPSTFINR
jgi:DNA helicase-2/ATP-dependent DNA helicase PcrA